MITFLDVDQHADETSDVWSGLKTSMPESYLNIEELDDGSRWLRSGPNRIMRVPDMEPEDADHRNRARATLSDRVHVLDQMAAEATVIFPTLGLLWPSIIRDPAVVHPHLEAWNRWVGESCSGAMGRLRAVGQISLTDVDWAVKEIKRSARRGIAGIFLRMIRYRDADWTDPANDPVWQALSDANLPLFLHAVEAPSRRTTSTDQRTLQARAYLNRHLAAEAVVSDLLLGGILERFPNLRIGVFECGASWVEGFLDRLDSARTSQGWKHPSPRELFETRVRVAVLPDEPVGKFLMQGSDQILMASSDFPHPEGTVAPIEKFGSLLGDVPGPIAQAFFAENADYLLSGSR